MLDSALDLIDFLFTKTLFENLFFLLSTFRVVGYSCWLSVMSRPVYTCAHSYTIYQKTTLMRFFVA